MTAKLLTDPCTYAVGTTRGNHHIAIAERRLASKSNNTLTVEWYRIVCKACGGGKWERHKATRDWLGGKPRTCAVCADSAKPTGRFCPVCSSCPGRQCVRCGGVPERIERSDAWARDGEQRAVRL
jgi:hypothetical protein